MNPDVEVRTSKNIDIKVSFNFEGYFREIIFHFEDGVMRKPTSNFPYQKSRMDWECYNKAIEIMLEKSKKFYKSEKLKEIPF